MKYELMPIEKHLHFQIFKLALLLSRELTKALKDFDLTPERWQILAALWTAGEPLNQTQLGEITVKDKPSISRLVDSMVQTGWLIKKTSEQDNRAYLIRPSQKANANRDKVVSALYGYFEPIIQEFGPENRQELSALVVTYTGILEKRNSKRDLKMDDNR